MLNQNTRKVISSLAQINNSQIISYPVTLVKSGTNMQAFLDMTKLDEEEFNKVGFFSVTEFLSITDIVEDAQIEANEAGTITIKNSNTSVTYNSTNIKMLEEAGCSGNFDLIDKIKSNETIASFKLLNVELNKIKKMSGLLKSMIIFRLTGNGSDVVVSLEGTEKSSNNYAVTFDDEASSSEFVMDVNMSNINKLPGSDYDVTVHRSTKGSIIVVFSSINVPGLNIFCTEKVKNK